MKVFRLGCAPSNSAWFHTCAMDNRTIGQAEGNEQSPTVWADATDAKYVTVSVAYVEGAEGGGERGKGRGIGRVFYLFLSPAPPLRFLRVPRRLRYRYQSWSLKLTDAFCCSQGLALYVLNDNELCRHNGSIIAMWLKILNDAGWRVIDAYIEYGPTHISMLLRLFYAFFDSHNLAFDLYWTMIILSIWAHCCPVTKILNDGNVLFKTPISIMDSLTFHPGNSKDCPCAAPPPDTDTLHWPEDLGRGFHLCKRKCLRTTLAVELWFISAFRKLKEWQHALLIYFDRLLFDFLKMTFVRRSSRCAELRG